VSSGAFARLPRDLARDPRLTARDRSVYANLLLHRNRRTGLCRPTVRTLAAEEGCAVPTVKRSLRRLSAAGWILKAAGHGSDRAPNRYRFPFEEGAESRTAPAKGSRAADGAGPESGAAPAKGSPVTPELEEEPEGQEQDLKPEDLKPAAAEVAAAAEEPTSEYDPRGPFAAIGAGRLPGIEAA